MMANRDNITHKLAELLRDELLNHDAVSIEGIGVFKRKHVPASEETLPDGTTVLNPPRYEISFKTGEGSR